MKAESGKQRIPPNFVGGSFGQRQRRGMFIAWGWEEPSSSVRSDIRPHRCRPAGAEEFLPTRSYKHSAPLGLSLPPTVFRLLYRAPLLFAFWVTVVSAQQSANVHSPEIGADRRVTFRLNAPKAQEVALTGEFLKSKTPLVKDANGVWTVTVGPIEPEIYHSMGGGQALSIGLNNLDLFSHVAGFSSGLGNAANFPKTYASLIGQPETANRKIRMLWVGCGAEDGAFAASNAFSEFLTKHNIKHTFRESGGAHTWIVWRRYLHEIALLLFQ